MSEKDLTKNPAYGLLGFNRRTGGMRVLFGSDIKHNETIVMTVYQADASFEYHQMTPHARNKILEIEMSPVQFANIISNMGCAQGHPVTIRELNGQRTEPLEFESLAKRHIKDYEEKLAAVNEKTSELIKSLKAILAQKTILKADREELISLAENIRAEISCNTVFQQNMFVEQMETVVENAKSELSAYFERHKNELNGEMPVELITEINEKESNQNE